MAPRETIWYSVTGKLSNMWLSSLRSKPFRASSARKLGREQKTLQISDWGGAASISHRNCAPPQPFLSVSLVPSRYLSVFWGETRLGIKLRIARGVMGRVEGKIAPSSYSVNKASMILKNSPNLYKTLKIFILRTLIRTRPSMRPRTQDIGQVLFRVFIDWDEVEGNLETSCENQQFMSTCT